MTELFSPEYVGQPFRFLDAYHIGALVAILLLNFGLFWLRRSSAGAKSQARVILAATIWTAECSWHVWKLVYGIWTPQVMLPLNLCSILIWLAGAMLVWRSHRLYEFVYFLGIGGAVQYLVTPDLGQYGFPHFRFFQAYTSHGLLLTAPLYLTVVEGFRPTWHALRRVVVGANVYMLLIFAVNRAIGSNFLMLSAKPATPSLLDLLPAWPYYILFMELIGLATCLLLLAPFVVVKRRPSAAAVDV